MAGFPSVLVFATLLTVAFSQLDDNQANAILDAIETAARGNGSIAVQLPAIELATEPADEINQEVVALLHPTQHYDPKHIPSAKVQW